MYEEKLSNVAESRENSYLKVSKRPLESKLMKKINYKSVHPQLKEVNKILYIY